MILQRSGDDFGSACAAAVDHYDHGVLSGSIQRGGLKLTIARYYTPSGRSIQAKGIIPDIEVKRKMVEPVDEGEEKFIKEKDLRNHLGASPVDENVDGESSDSEPAEPSRLKEAQQRVGPLDPDILKKDYQLQRGLDILIGYDILAGQ